MIKSYLFRLLLHQAHHQRQLLFGLLLLSDSLIELMIDLPLPRELPLDLHVASIVHVLKQLLLPPRILVIEVLPGSLVLKLLLLLIQEQPRFLVGQVLLVGPNGRLDRLSQVSFMTLILKLPILCFLLHVHQCLLLFFERDECPVLLVEGLLFPLISLVFLLMLFESLLEVVAVLLDQLETELVGHRAHKLEISLLLLQAHAGL